MNSNITETKYWPQIVGIQKYAGWATPPRKLGFILFRYLQQQTFCPFSVPIFCFILQFFSFGSLFLSVEIPSCWHLGGGTKFKKDEKEVIWVSFKLINFCIYGQSTSVCSCWKFNYYFYFKLSSYVDIDSFLFFHMHQIYCNLDKHKLIQGRKLNWLLGIVFYFNIYLGCTVLTKKTSKQKEGDR